jgi:hypothetical protein
LIIKILSSICLQVDDDEADDSIDDLSRNVGAGAAAVVDNSQVLDLDTRLKLLMKDKTGAMPAFLLQELNSGSDNESDKEVEKLSNKKSVEQLVQLEDDDSDSPLSRPPSPFLSAEHYYANLKNRPKKNSATRNSKSARPESQNSDRMSLSR